LVELRARQRVRVALEQRALCLFDWLRDEGLRCACAGRNCTAILGRRAADNN